MADKFKSIFRRKEFEKIYEYGIREYIQLDKDFFMSTWGCKMIESEEPSSNCFLTEIADKELETCNIEMPMLEIGDEFFLHNIQELVKIKKRYRSSEGSVIYYVEDKFVETENTQKSKELTNKRLDNWKHDEKAIKKLKKEFEDYKKEYKYKHRFFNKKAND